MILLEGKWPTKKWDLPCWVPIQYVFWLGFFISVSLKMITPLVSISKHPFIPPPPPPLTLWFLFCLIKVYFWNSKYFSRFSLGKIRKVSAKGGKEEYECEQHNTGERFCSLVEMTKDEAKCAQALELDCWKKKLWLAVAGGRHDLSKLEEPSYTSEVSLLKKVKPAFHQNIINIIVSWFSITER